MTLTSPWLGPAGTYDLAGPLAVCVDKVVIVVVVKRVDDHGSDNTSPGYLEASEDVMSDDNTKYTPTGAPIDDRFATPPAAPVEPTDPAPEPEADDDPPKRATARTKHATRKSKRR